MMRRDLERHWLELTKVRMPEAASGFGWPVRFDHCFQRILLDNAAGKVWYDAFAGRPAYAHAPEPLLRAAIALGEAALSGAADLAQLNRKSLALRAERRRAR